MFLSKCYVQDDHHVKCLRKSSSMLKTCLAPAFGINIYIYIYTHTHYIQKENHCIQAVHRSNAIGSSRDQPRYFLAMSLFWGENKCVELDQTPDFTPWCSHLFHTTLRCHPHLGFLHLSHLASQGQSSRIWKQKGEVAQ